MVKDGKGKALKSNLDSADLQDVEDYNMLDSLTQVEYTATLIAMYGAIVIFVILVFQLALANASRAALTPPMKLGGAAFNVLERENVTGFVSVVDGDTVAIVRDGSRELVRLFGVDAPEVRRPHCVEEELQGEKAKLRLGEIMKSARKVEVERLKSKDKYGRTLANMYIDGRNLQYQLITEGFAHVYNPTVGKDRWCNTG
jgi:endonuclease YncB( thermonuclease family)